MDTVLETPLGSDAVQVQEPAMTYDVLKEKIYTCYKEEIASLISKIEVECHTLPRDAAQGVDELFQMLATAEVEQDAAQKDALLLAAGRMLQVLHEMLCIRYVDHQIEAVRRYQRELKNFNNGVIVKDKDGNEMLLQEYIRKKMVFVKSYRKERKKFFRQFDHNGGLMADPEELPTMLAQYVQLIDEVVEAVEDNYHRVIGSGYNMVALSRVLWLLSTGIPVILAIRVVLSYLSAICV
ncbi:MAG: hypothetical protein HDT26_13665 [Subdoligranulum sp.]|nr:hypothetical protein [Subdoligranulum sp.]MBD5095291.1 hypothetical protein [Subdoligranulum sp.]